MRIPLCPFRPRSLLRRLNRKLSKTGKGQVMVIFALILVVLLVFVGLAIDAGSLYVSYGQLKRAVDASAVAAANDFKRLEGGMDIGDRIDSMKGAASEVLQLHNVDMEALDMELYICDSDGDGIRDADLSTAVPQFYNRCPDTASNYSPRKLVWVEANLQAPLYFLQLIGFKSVNLNTNAIAEAAPVDVVIVLDVSESMASDTIGTLSGTYPGIVDDYDPDGSAISGSTYEARPTGCNLSNNCQPLLQAKEAANAFIDSLYEGYDQVAIVTFDNMSISYPVYNKAGTQVNLTDNFNGYSSSGTFYPGAKDIVNNIALHDDAPFAKMWPYWRSTLGSNKPVFNPTNPEDRDGDGSDWDPLLPSCTYSSNPMCCTPDEDRWDENPKFDALGLGWGGVPCDEPNLWDAYDWDGDGVWTENDNIIGSSWAAKNLRDPDGSGSLSAFVVDSPLSTCTGCGIRAAANILKQNGRPGAVWVIIFLSDGIVNQSDTANTMGNELSGYPNGFCTGGAGYGFWSTICIDFDSTTRYCIDDDENTCPAASPPLVNNVIWESSDPSSNYSVLDYARDMVDQAALTKSTNTNELPGNEIAIYAIGLGDGIGQGTGVIGEDLLRYMAAVGDDGDRTTDLCSSTAHRQDCGQYYYAPTGDALLPIFEDIATRIYTRITD